MRYQSRRERWEAGRREVSGWAKLGLVLIAIVTIMPEFWADLLLGFLGG